MPRGAVGLTGRPVVPPRSRMCAQSGGYAGPFASPGLGCDDAPPTISGFDDLQRAPQG
jgi:hypothetical protein